MTSHELANLLLTQHDMPVALFVYGPGDNETTIPVKDAGFDFVTNKVHLAFDKADFNDLIEAVDWMRPRVAITESPKGTVVTRFKSQSEGDDDEIVLAHARDIFTSTDVTVTIAYVDTTYKSFVQFVKKKELK